MRRGRNPSLKTQDPRPGPRKNTLPSLSYLLVLGSWLLVSDWMGPVLAQCAMCKTAAAAQGAQATEALNLGVLVLLIPPVLLFAGVFFLALSFRDPSSTDV